MIDENTGEEPKCLICGSPEDCSHLVADIDRTFGECNGGALFDMEQKFRLEIATKFLKLLEVEANPEWQNHEIEELWQKAQAEYDPDDEYVMLDGYVFFFV